MTTQPTLAPGAFAAKWRGVTTTEKAASQEHFIDLCRMLVVLLARLGVDLGAQGHGLGAALVKAAMLRAHQAAGTVGARALLIHAESATAREFYLHLAEFEPSPTDPLHLLRLMADIEGIIGE